MLDRVGLALQTVVDVCTHVHRPCGCWESGPLAEWPVLLMTKPPGISLFAQHPGMDVDQGHLTFIPQINRNSSLPALVL